MGTAIIGKFSNYTFVYVAENGEILLSVVRAKTRIEAIDCFDENFKYKRIIDITKQD